ncbi:MAG TPA: tRNA dihydrouridine synthase DusB, partial [Lachnospiraceae bacterium]|nr:tRNA dihydrouridine synthase DusB [Lachnospiraceae bacterium]
VHGRTREQLYSGQADWEIIRQVKEAVKIPVIGNGDVTDPRSAEALVRETGCDGIM